MLLDIIILCLPFSIPSFYLAYKLGEKRFMGTIFNQQIALMCVISGGVRSISGCLSVNTLFRPVCARVHVARYHTAPATVLPHHGDSPGDNFLGSVYLQVPQVLRPVLAQLLLLLPQLVCPVQVSCVSLSVFFPALHLTTQICVGEVL